MALCGLLPALALAADPVLLCAGQSVLPGADGRALGHFPYLEAAGSDLVAGPPGFAIGQPCQVHRDMLPDLYRLLAAAGNAGVTPQLGGISCFRSIAHQRSVFCSQIGPRMRCKNAADRARSVGPPGFSEHATGYAIDFGIRPSPRCPDLNPCIATSFAGQWLLSHAREFGFEQSFPAGNLQGVTWEPWHWRWVGASVNAPGAVRARLTFARARGNFPANPGITDMSDYWLTPPRTVIAPYPTNPPVQPATPPFITLPPTP